MAETKLELNVDGMHCASCVNRVETAVKGNVEGVRDVSVDLISGKARVFGDVDSKAVVKAIQTLGYEAEVVDKNKDRQEEDSAGARKQTPLFMWILSGVFIALALIDHLAFHENHAVGLQIFRAALATLTIVLFGRATYVSAVKELFRFSPGMDSLVFLGTGVPYLYSLSVLIKVLTSTASHTMQMQFFDAVVMVIAIIWIGRQIESRAVGQSQSALEELANLKPQKAQVKQEGQANDKSDFKELPTSEIKAGDRVLVRPGDTLPVNGTITEGHGWLQAAVVTGESMAEEKSAGDDVLEGMILNANESSSSLVIKATTSADQSFLSQMISIMEDAQSNKPELQKLADTLAGWIVPLIIIVAFLTEFAWWVKTGVWTAGIEPAMAVLVAACPCAMGLATPVAIKVAVGKAAQEGLIIQRASALETASKINFIALDKTGTLTTGKPSVTHFVKISRYTDEEFIQWVTALEKHSGHPIAHALTQFAKNEKIEVFHSVEHFNSLTGLGIEGRVDGHHLIVGGESLMQKKAIDCTELKESAKEFEAEGNTLIWVAIDDKLAGLIGIADTLREGAVETIQYLRKKKIKLAIVTGDGEGATKPVARELDINTVYTAQSPENKKALIKGWQSEGKLVSLTGDGINDAPALAQANLGVSLGDGTAVAQSAADVVLMEGGINTLRQLIQLGRATVVNIKQNLVWAFLYNIVAVPLAAFGIIHPVAAGIAMSASSIIVVFNALRLKGLKL